MLAVGIAAYKPDVLSATDYSSFGASLLGRQFNPAQIEYGFNGKWNEVETGYQNYGMRDYSAKARRFTKVDPITSEYPMLTPYQYASNNPVALVDIDGKEGGWELSTPKHNIQMRIEFDSKLPPKRTNNPATSSAIAAINPVHSEAPPAAVQQQHMRANTAVTRNDPTQDEIQRMREKSMSFTLRPTPPAQPANEFEAGAVQGVHMAMYAVTAEYCPTCAVAMGARQMQTGIQNGDAMQTISGATFFVGGVGKLNEQGLLFSNTSSDVQVNGFSFGGFKKIFSPGESNGGGFLGGAKIPLSIRPAGVNEIAYGCEAVATSVQKAIGGDFLQITPKFGNFLGRVNYEGGVATDWAHHVAVIKDGIVYDRMTGSVGMPLESYTKMFEYHTDLKFEQTKTITVK